jgi:hypothetical protein
MTSIKVKLDEYLRIIGFAKVDRLKMKVDENGDTKGDMIFTGNYEGGYSKPFEGIMKIDDCYIMILETNNKEKLNELRNKIKELYGMDESENDTKDK